MKEKKLIKNNYIKKPKSYIQLKNIKKNEITTPITYKFTKL